MNDDLVVVTGAGGFIGGHLVSALRQQGHRKIRAVDIKPTHEWFQSFRDVHNLTADLTLKDSCREAVANARWIYNLAANMGGIGFIECNKALCMLSALINTHMLMASRDLGAERYFFSSSACVYSSEKQRVPQNPGLRESDAYPAMPEDGYGWEKLISERMCRHFTEDFGLETRVARLHNVYGPHGAWCGGREKAPAAICRKVAAVALGRTDTIEIWGDGEQTRSFMYIDDCVEGIGRIMASDIVAPINLGSSEMVSINQLVDLIENIAGVKLIRAYSLNAPKGVAGRNSDNTMIRKRLGWEPSIPLRVGLEKTYLWIYGQMVPNA